MRNTRTLAACVAATTLFGLLSATPALAAPPEPVPATQPTPGSGSPAQSTGANVTLFGDEALVTLPDDAFRSVHRIAVIVEGEPVAQITTQVTRGVSKVTDGAATGRWIYHIPGVKAGDRVAVTEYLGWVDDGFDDSLRRQRLFAGTLGEAATTPAAPASTAPPAPQEPTPAPAPTPTAVPPAPAPTPTAVPPAPVTAQNSGVRAVASGGQARVVLPLEMFRSERRYVIIVDGRPVAEVRDNYTRGTNSISTDYRDREATFIIRHVNPGQRLEVWEYDGALDSGFDNSLRKEKVFDQQM